jgi:hypothetical protein
MKRANWILGAMASIILPFAVYLGSYLWLGESYYDGPIHVRAYKSWRMTQLFQPAARVESWVTGEPTLVGLTAEPIP